MNELREAVKRLKRGRREELITLRTKDGNLGQTNYYRNC